MSDDEAYIEMDGKRHYLKEYRARQKNSVAYAIAHKNKSEKKDVVRLRSDIGEAPETKFIRRRRAEILARKRKVY
jgi:hypothetical protein